MASIYPAAINAADILKDQFILGEVVVTARAADNSMTGGTEIGQSALRTYGKQTVDQMLDPIPGAVASNTGGSCNERLIFIRGWEGVIYWIATTSWWTAFRNKVETFMPACGDVTEPWDINLCR